LKDLYQKLKARENVEDFELVFCSMDKTDAEYQSYTSDMPWYCLPHTSPVMGKLANQYGAQGIPHLVVLDKDGTVLQQDGVGEVSIDPEGSDFPWRPKPLVDLLPKEYLTTDNKRRPMSELDDKYLMLYMSAHWCPPCQVRTTVMYRQSKVGKQICSTISMEWNNSSSFSLVRALLRNCPRPIQH
jgi:nucleoredoxin